ncbi:MAG: bifunctional folylpolyglutamate synthase/dihydrofolate synthase [Planctomycetes bacterium]|nr:bifunctional folylpolyglutamate synthase/dihydrofolate synthase [Planctomycetota bacterium]
MPSQLPNIEQRRQQALDFLLNRINYERTIVTPYGHRQLKLDRMRQLLTRLGNPDAGLPIVHVAGTKGKGSTSTMVAAMLHAAGYETGLFSSPHLEQIEERFAINGQPCPSDELVALVDQLRPVVQAMDQESARADSSMSPTYFELTTALALMHFAQHKVDIAVLEVGLGGRLDSTNVCQPAVTVITSISLDHTKQLGTTLPEIAAEKAGIIKPGVPLLCGHIDKAPQRVITEIAKQHGCRMLIAGHDFRHRYHPPRLRGERQAIGRLDFEGDFADEHVRLADLPLKLLGEHQAANAALAIATVAELRQQGWSIPPEAIRQATAEATLPGRVEVIGTRPTIVLDVAHNVASAEALVEVLETSFSNQTRVLLLAATQEKDVAGVVRVLLPHFEKVIVTQYQDNPRAVPTAELEHIVGKELNRLGRDSCEDAICVPTSPYEAWQVAQQLVRENQLVCITGSFFIVAELRGQLLADSAATRASPVELSEPQKPRGNNQGK